LTAGPGGLRLSLRAVPQIEPDEVLARVGYASPCGTDLHIDDWDAWAQGKIRPGRVTGHEWEGEVVHVGALVKSVRVGDRVTADGHFTCGLCRRCRTGEAHVCEDVRGLGLDVDGAFADYVRIPAANVWPIPAAVPVGWGALLDPLGNAVNMCMTAGVARCVVLITGAGPIGQMAIQVARSCGAAKIFVSDVNPRRRQLAERFHPDAVFDATRADLVQAIRTAAGGAIDVLLECSGASQAIDAGMQVLRNRGTAIQLGIPPGRLTLDYPSWIFKSVKIEMIYGRVLWRDWYHSEALVTSGAVNLAPIISEIVPFDEWRRGFDLMRSGESVKVLFDLSA
jgi:threonine 3-dehydrogenase